MQDDDRDWLLREMGQLGEGEFDRLPSPEVITAYREGRLDENQARSLEALLARHRQARRRLAEAAGVGAIGPSPASRERALRAFDETFAERREQRRQPRTWSRRRWSAAAAIAASVVLAVTLSVNGPQPLPDGLAYEVAAYGLAEQRSAPTGEAVVKALPATTIRLEVTPHEVAEGEVEFGLYRLRDRQLERLLPGSTLRLEVERGSAVFAGRAGDLLAAREGEHSLYVAVARPGNLPVRQALAEGSSPVDALADAGERLVYEQVIRLIEDSR